MFAGIISSVGNKNGQGFEVFAPHGFANAGWADHHREAAVLCVDVNDA